MIVYSIPAAAYGAFPGRPAILRTADPAELSVALGSNAPEGLAYVQLTDLSADIAPLARCGEGLAVDLVMSEPASELPLLYRFSGLLARHPVRVSVPWLPGLARAVKLAVSLGFAVRLTGHRPTPQAVAEARQALDAFLHNPTVAQPVEPFHGVLVALVHDTPVRLWSLLERDPAQIRILDERGEALPDQGPASATALRDTLVAAGAECRECEWLASCEGYFKWPSADYDCADVKRLFADLREAAAELKAGLAAYAELQGEPRHGI